MNSMSSPEFEQAACNLAQFIAQKESFRYKTLDEALYHQSKWERILPEAKKMLQAAFPVTQAAPVSPRPDILEELLAHIQWMKEHGELRIKQTRDSVELNAFNQGRVDAAESLLGFMNDLLKQHEVTLTPSSKEKV